MIEINNLTTNPVDEEFLRKVAEKVLKEESREPNLSIAIIGQGRMRKLNKRYLGKNRVTDVLAFGQTSRYKVKDLKYKTQDLGEIAICLREVKKNARRFAPLEITGLGKKHKESKSLTGFDSTFEQELARVLIHGILHLLGYDHEKNEKAAKEMEEKQKYYLNKIIKA